MSYLDKLEKIANETLTEHEMNPDVAPQPTPEEVQEAQTGQDTPVQQVSDEEMALRQQLDADAMAEQQQAEEERAEDHAAVDRALLEGAAEEVVSEMADEEIKDLLISKAASEMLALGSLATLVDIATNDNFDGQTKEAATQTLEYMALSRDNFVDGLNKVASDVYSQEVNQNDLFSIDGVAYIRSNIQKLANYDDLTKVASDNDVDALGAIVENEADQIGEAIEIVEEAYDEALKEIAKEDIKESIIESGEYDEGLVEGAMEEQLAYAYADMMDKQAKIGNPVKAIKNTLRNASGKNVKDAQQAYNTSLRTGSHSDKLKNRYNVSEQVQNTRDARKKVRNAAIGTAGVGAVGGAGKMVHNISKNRNQEPDVQMEQVASANRFLDEVEMYKEAKIGNPVKSVVNTVRNATGKNVKDARKTYNNSLRTGSHSDKLKNRYNVSEQVQNTRDARKKVRNAAIGTAGVTAAGGAGKVVHDRRKRNQTPDVQMEQVASVNRFLDEVEMYKQANFIEAGATSSNQWLGFDKQANPIKLVRNLKSNKRELEKTVKAREQLAEQLKRTDVLTGDTRIREEYNRLATQGLGLERDVRNGQLLAYGVPGAALTTGAVFGGKKLADNKAKKKESQALLDQAAFEAGMNQTDVY